jgi:uncharacterized protein (TIGR02246 family)
MRPCFLAFSFALAVSLYSQAPPADDRAALMSLETTWNEAHVRGDADTLAMVWDEDLQVAVPGMQPLNKAAALAVMRSSNMKFEKYESSGIDVKLYGDAAVVTGKIDRTRKFNEKLAADDWRFTKVYIRKAGQWRVVAFHASPAGN